MILSKIFFIHQKINGAKNCKIGGYQNNDTKDGGETNPAISHILGSKPVSDPVLDSKYQEYCQSLGFVAVEKGAFGVARKYWKLT